MAAINGRKSSDFLVGCIITKLVRPDQYGGIDDNIYEPMFIQIMNAEPNWQPCDNPKKIELHTGQLDENILDALAQD